jgi:CHASE3 domain sensor protein
MDRIYASRALADALAPLLGAEVEAGNKAVSEEWAKDASQEKIRAWTEKGKEINDEVIRVMQETTSVEYGRLMRKVR